MYKLIYIVRPFTVPASSKYKGTRVINGKTTQLWQYVWKTKEFNWISDYFVFTSNGINFPLRIVYYGNRPTVTVDWDIPEIAEYPESMYAIPPSWDCIFTSSNQRYNQTWETIGIMAQKCPP
jgi:hypothetical protein